jgi:hypothetical protein
VFVRSNPQGAKQAAADAATVVAWAHAQGQPRGTLTMWDAETAVDSPYELTFDQDLRNEDGDLEIAYGSKSTVLQMPTPSGGDDVADWTGNIPSSLASMAEQFYSGPDYDLNKFRTGAPLWDLRPAPTAPTSAPSAHSLEEDTMAQAIDGQVDIGWSTGTMAVVQVSANGGSPLNKGQTPKLSVCLHTHGGAVWLAGADGIPPWEPTEAGPVLRFDAHKANAFGITVAALNANGAGTRFSAFVAP